MKKYGILPGTILIGTGLYFFLYRMDTFQNGQQFFSWPTFLLIIGFAFLLQAYIGKDPASIFSGVMFTGIGVHFHGQNMFEAWPVHWGVYTLLLGIAFLLQHQKMKRGILPGILFLLISVIGIFDTETTQVVNQTGVLGKWFMTLWPAALIAIGFYLLFMKK
ncbi:DUF5668 domain-containing protein [Bacillus tianshenii]|nr:DUF5668 domain-containing protein [Bacillus tianshenii]